MTPKTLLGMCAYVDGKHESQINFSLEFPEAVAQVAREMSADLEGRLLMLVGLDEMSRKRELHTNIQPFNIRQVVECDAIFDRMGTMVPFAGMLLDQAMYSGAQVFNRPVSVDESKARDYMIAGMLGFNVPRTVVLTQGSYVRAKMAEGNPETMEFDIDFDEAVRQVGGYPCFLKKANGGGRAHVYRVKNKAELFEQYQVTREMLMVLQEGVDFDRYVRTFCLGDRVVHTFYDIDQPDGQKYSWPEPGSLSGEERLALDQVIPTLAKELLTPFCTMEITRSRKDGKWYFIDITNGCNFDMREGELSTPIYKVAKAVLVEELINWSLNPRPMIVHTHLQEYVLRQQLYRGYLKGQNLEYLLRFAHQIGFAVDEKELEEEAKKFADGYAKLYG